MHDITPCVVGVVIYFGGRQASSFLARDKIQRFGGAALVREGIFRAAAGPPGHQNGLCWWGAIFMTPDFSAVSGLGQNASRGVRAVKCIDFFIAVSIIESKDKANLIFPYAGCGRGLATGAEGANGKKLSGKRTVSQWDSGERTFSESAAEGEAGLLAILSGKRTETWA